MDDYADIVHVITPDALPEPASRDPDDDEVLACAIAAHVDAIVSGDTDLLTQFSPLPPGFPAVPRHRNPMPGSAPRTVLLGL